jgi:hypothetical protein
MKRLPKKPDWRELADRGELGAWLGRHKGFRAYMCLGFIARELRASRTTKAQRLELAYALERLETVVLNLEVPYRKSRGRKDRFQTWHDAALVNALVKYRGACQVDAVRAVVLMRGGPGGFWKAHDRIERYLRAERAGKKQFLGLGSINHSHNPAELKSAATFLPKQIGRIHRIK